MYTSAADKISVSNSRHPQTKKGHSAHNKKAISSKSSNSFSLMGLVRFAAGVYFTSANPVSAHTHGAPLAHSVTHQRLFANYTANETNSQLHSDVYRGLTEYSQSEDSTLRQYLNISDYSDFKDIDTSACTTPVTHDAATDTDFCLGNVSLALTTREADEAEISAQKIKDELNAQVRHLMRGEIFALSDGKVYSKTCGFSAQEISDAMNVLVTEANLGFEDDLSAMIEIYKDSGGDASKCTTVQSEYTESDLDNCVTQLNTALQSNVVKTNGFTDTKISVAIQSYATANGVVTIVTDGDQCLVTLSPTFSPSPAPSTAAPYTSAPSIAPAPAPTTAAPAPVQAPSPAPSEGSSGPTSQPSSKSADGAEKLSTLGKIEKETENIASSSAFQASTPIALLVICGFGIALKCLKESWIQSSHDKLPSRTKYNHIPNRTNVRSTLLKDMPKTNYTEDAKLLILFSFLAQEAMTYQSSGWVSRVNTHLHLKPALVNVFNEIANRITTPEVAPTLSRGSLSETNKKKVSALKNTAFLLNLFLSAIQPGRLDSTKNTMLSTIKDHLTELENNPDYTAYKHTESTTLEKVAPKNFPNEFSHDEALTLTRILQYISNPLYAACATKNGDILEAVEEGRFQGDEDQSVHSEIKSVAEDSVSVDRSNTFNQTPLTNRTHITEQTEQTEQTYQTPKGLMYARAYHAKLAGLDNISEDHQSMAEEEKFEENIETDLKEMIRYAPSSQGQAGVPAALRRLLTDILLLTKQLNEIDTTKPAINSQYQTPSQIAIKKANIQEERRKLFIKLHDLFPNHISTLLSKVTDIKLPGQDITYTQKEVLVITTEGNVIYKTTDRNDIETSSVQTQAKNDAIYKIITHALEQPHLLLSSGFTVADVFKMSSSQLSLVESIISEEVAALAEDAYRHTTSKAINSRVALLTRSGEFITRANDQINLIDYCGRPKPQSWLQRQGITNTPFPPIAHMMGINAKRTTGYLLYDSISKAVPLDSKRYWRTLSNTHRTIDAATTYLSGHPRFADYPSIDRESLSQIRMKPAATSMTQVRPSTESDTSSNAGGGDNGSEFDPSTNGDALSMNSDWTTSAARTQHREAAGAYTTLQTETQQDIELAHIGVVTAYSDDEYRRGGGSYDLSFDSRYNQYEEGQDEEEDKQSSSQQRPTTPLNGRLPIQITSYIPTSDSDEEIKTSSNRRQTRPTVMAALPTRTLGRQNSQRMNGYSGAGTGNGWLTTSVMSDEDSMHSGYISQAKHTGKQLGSTSGKQGHRRTQNPSPTVSATVGGNKSGYGSDEVTMRSDY